ncbi:unnamed protein product [Adineta steineri]|uniref:Uncharacterized protein n=2 Tax=Adineta steineri TaxID=433720 RepID=A0A814WZQ5_9BILA|nr:unnamed protein product [Adineta steineri]CAF3742437.1 unnamed protein product [Adineta steineri]
MNLSILSKYSQPPYMIIGLDLLNELSGDENLMVINQIFKNINDIEDFIVKHTNYEKFVIIISGNLSSDQLNHLKSYSQIDSIYLFSKSYDANEQLKCIYTKPRNRYCLNTLTKLLKKFWFIFGLAIAMIFAVLFPYLGASGGILHTEYSLKWGCVIIIFFLSGLSLQTNEIATEIFHFRLHIFTQVFNLVFIPLVVFVVCLLLIKLSFNKILIGGIIMMACTTTTISSNVIMTKNAGGNEPAALVNAILGNILGVFVSPALIWLFMLNSHLNILQHEYNIHDYLHVLFNLGLTVIVPLIIGQIIYTIWTEKILWAKTKFHFPELNSLALLILLWSIFCDLFQSGLLNQIKTRDLIIVIALNATFYITFSLLAMFFARLPNIFICGQRTISSDKQPLLLESGDKQKTLIERWRFSREDTIAIMFCAATKTVAKGVPLISAVNSANNQSLAGLFSLPLILYHVEQLILGAIEVNLLQYWLKSK